MSKRTTTAELIAELRQFNHFEAAARMEQLATNLRATQDALTDLSDFTMGGKLKEHA